jgi:hypothetical protein
MLLCPRCMVVLFRILLYLYHTCTRINVTINWAIYCDRACPKATCWRQCNARSFTLHQLASSQYRCVALSPISDAWSYFSRIGTPRCRKSSTSTLESSVYYLTTGHSSLICSHTLYLSSPYLRPDKPWSNGHKIWPWLFNVARRSHPGDRKCTCQCIARIQKAGRSTNHDTNQF